MLRRWWGPKVALWLILVVISFLIPNPFFMFYGSTVSLIGATLFILVGLVLLIDFAHSWSETCLEKWEETDSPFWKFTLIGSTLSLFIVQIVLVAIQYAFFAGRGCGLNQFFISFNLALSVLVTVLSVSPAVQEANPRSGLAQSGMVVAYTAYLVMSAIANHDDGAEGEGKCNPLQARAAGAKSGMVVLGAVFTFLAIACAFFPSSLGARADLGASGSRRLDEPSRNAEQGTRRQGQEAHRYSGRLHSRRIGRRWGDGRRQLSACKAGQLAVPGPSRRRRCWVRPSFSRLSTHN